MEGRAPRKGVLEPRWRGIQSGRGAATRGWQSLGIGVTRGRGRLQAGNAGGGSGALRPGRPHGRARRRVCPEPAARPEGRPERAEAPPPAGARRAPANKAPLRAGRPPPRPPRPGPAHPRPPPSPQSAPCVPPHPPPEPGCQPQGTTAAAAASRERSPPDTLPPVARGGAPPHPQDSHLGPENSDFNLKAILCE